MQASDIGASVDIDVELATPAPFVVFDLQLLRVISVLCTNHDWIEVFAMQDSNANL